MVARKPILRWSWWATACLVAGCAVPDPAVSPPANEGIETSPPVPAADLGERPEPEPYASELPTIEPQGMPIATAVASFVWTDSPAARDVPDQPVTGMIHGRAFICRYTSVAPDDEDRLPTYLLRFSNRARGALCGFTFDDDAVSIEWHLPTGVGEWRKALGEARPEGAYAWYTVRQADGTPFTRNAEWACYLRIEETRGATESGGVDSLSGRIALVFDDPEKSWIAGAFVADGCR